jgi:acetyl esterase/lipase
MVKNSFGSQRLVRFATLLVPLLLLFLLCSVAQAGSMTESLDVPYGTDEYQRLDIWRPQGAKGRLPAVIWVHGGGWGGTRTNDAKGMAVLANTLVTNGFVAISCDYRIVPKHRHPAQVEDVQRVVRWLRANSKKYNIDPERIGAVGISAGGHLTAMLAVRETLKKQGDSLDKFSSKVNAAVCLNGPTDLRGGRPDLFSPIMTEALRNLLGDDFETASKERSDVSPLLFVDRKSAPLLFVVGATDPWVPNAHATIMADALKAQNIQTGVISLADEGHGNFPWASPRTMAALLEWFNKHLKKR